MKLFDSLIDFLRSTMKFYNIIYILILFFLSNTSTASDSFLKNPPVVNNKIIRLATTTSTENSGLLNYLFPFFEKNTTYTVHVIAVGTGKALRMGKDGDVEVLLVHALEAEQAFVKKRYGLKRHPVMYNDFVVIGDISDPAAIKYSTSVQMAFKKIQSSQSLFISRGDDSGTHKKEIKIWQSAFMSKEVSIDQPKGQWYREIGQGMGKAIQPTAVEHGRIAAINMVKPNSCEHHGSINMNILDTMGLVSTSFGQWMGVPDGEEAVLLDERNYRYLKLQFKGECLIGVSSLGHTQNIGVVRGLIRGKVKLGIWKDRLMKDPSCLMEAFLASSVAQA